MTTAQMARRRAWVTGPDGVEHSQPRNGRGRALCGSPYLDARYDRPDLRARRCDRCRELLEGKAPIG